MDSTPLGILTAIHVLISLIGIASGFVVIAGFLRGKLLSGWNRIFLVNTIATSVTGFLFPITKLTPGLVFGILSLFVLAAALVALYKHHLAGRWSTVYVVAALFAQYLNCFVLIVQSFQKVAPLHDLAPNGNEPPFAIAQGVALVAFIACGVLSVRRFKPALPA